MVKKTLHDSVKRIEVVIIQWRNIFFFHRGDYNRLEFLGDAVLKYVCSDYLFKEFPYHQEGHLTVKLNYLFCIVYVVNEQFLNIGIILLAYPVIYMFLL